MFRIVGVLVLVLAGCDSGGDSDEVVGADMGTMGDAGSPYTCDETRKRLIIEDAPDTLSCGQALETVTVGSLEVFKYEASHPLANADAAFPCADRNDIEFQAAQVPTEPCSIAGVRPWHSVKWEDADAACKQIGWQLCAGDTLMRTCGGEENLTFAYGGTFEAGKCNVREAFRPEGQETASAAPTGMFEECESPSGAFDVNGNLWEWTSDREEADGRARVYQGAGWRTIAQRHQDSNQACGTTTQLRGFSAPSFANVDVGFRCCRRAE